MKTPYELLGGDQGIKDLCKAFYRAMDTLDEAKAIRDMHGKDLSEIEAKLYLYLSGWLGGPPLYQKKYNTICLTAPHKGYAIGVRERDQWLLCMDTALEEVQASDEVKNMLKVPMFRIADAVCNIKE